jgi:hypothetical protein
MSSEPCLASTADEVGRRRQIKVGVRVMHALGNSLPFTLDAINAALLSQQQPPLSEVERMRATNEWNDQDEQRRACGYPPV